MFKNTGTKSVEELKGTLSTILSETVHRSFFNVSSSSSPDESVRFVSKIVHRAAEDISELMQSIREWEADERSKHRDEDDLSIQSRIHQRVDSYLESFFAEKRASSNTSPEVTGGTLDKAEQEISRSFGFKQNTYLYDTDTSLSEILIREADIRPSSPSPSEERKPAPVLPAMSVVFDENSTNPSFNLSFFTQVPNIQGENNTSTDAPGPWTSPPRTDSVPDISRLKLVSDDDTETFDTECYEEQQHVDSYAAPPSFFMPQMLSSIFVKPIQEILETSANSPLGNTEENPPTEERVQDTHTPLLSQDQLIPAPVSLSQTVTKQHTDSVPKVSPALTSGVNLFQDKEFIPVYHADTDVRRKVSHAGIGEPHPGTEGDLAPSTLLKQVSEINHFFQDSDQESAESLTPPQRPDYIARAALEELIREKLGSLDSGPRPFKVQQWEDPAKCPLASEELTVEQPVTENLNLVMKDFFHGLSEQQLNKMSRGINNILLRDQLIDMCLEMLRVSVQTISINKSMD